MCGTKRNSQREKSKTLIELFLHKKKWEKYLCFSDGDEDCKN